jgi:hypothetical protein
LAEDSEFLWVMNILSMCSLWRGNKAAGPMSQIYSM